jgi:hypothetical protein
MNSSFFPFINVTLTARKSIRVLASGLYVAICYFSFIWCFDEEIEVYRILLLVLKLKSFLSSKLAFLGANIPKNFEIGQVHELCLSQFWAMIMTQPKLIRVEIKGKTGR